LIELPEKVKSSPIFSKESSTSDNLIRSINNEINGSHYTLNPEKEILTFFGNQSLIQESISTKLEDGDIHVINLIGQGYFEEYFESYNKFERELLRLKKRFDPTRSH
jgi:hypothetical protein